MIRFDEYRMMRKISQRIEPLYDQERYVEALKLSYVLDQLLAKSWKRELEEAEREERRVC